jgi:GxxExxY protein
MDILELLIVSNKCRLVVPSDREIQPLMEHLWNTYAMDLLLCNGIVVELKAVTALTTDHEAQLPNYMRISKKKVGYLINFGPIGKLEWKRFVLD